MKKIMCVVLIVVAYLMMFRTEIDRGICLNANGDGKLYNGEPYYNYISYRDTGAIEGDEVVTLTVLNPMNMAPDDIIYRADWIRR
jgi:hypothetical protein